MKQELCKGLRLSLVLGSFWVLGAAFEGMMPLGRALGAALLLLLAQQGMARLLRPRAKKRPAAARPALRVVQGGGSHRPGAA